MLKFLSLVRFLRHSLQACLISLFCLHPVWADDTEIFFSEAAARGSLPNILLVLDASTSMLSYDCEDGTRTFGRTCGDGSPNGETTRLQRMKDALAEIIDSVGRVNIGVMRFSGQHSGGRVIYPMTNLDEVLCDGELCTEDARDDAIRKTVRQDIVAVSYTHLTLPTICSV